MKHLAAFYFSGTGNTRYIAEYLCRRLSAGYACACYDVSATENIPQKLAQADVVLLAFPIYGSAPPIPMRNFVRLYGDNLRGKQVALAETQYFFSGDGAASLGRAVKKCGGKLIGAEMFNMPNNLADCKLFPVKNGSEIEKRLARARKRADLFAERLLKGNARLRGFSPLSRGVGYFCQRRYWRRGEAEKRGRLKVDTDRCVGCGRCARSCPAENLLMQNGTPKPLGRCVLCYRCVNGCPCRAITLIGSAPPEKQYRGPEKKS